MRALLKLAAAWLLILTMGTAPSLRAQPLSLMPEPSEPATAGEAEVRAGEEVSDVAAEDAQLVRDLLARFSRVEALRGVEVEVNAGVATLSGEVPSEEDRERARALAQEVAGIVTVDNQLSRDTAVGVRLRPALARTTRTIEQLLGTLPLVVLAIGVVWMASWVGRWLGDRRVIRRLVGQPPFLVELARQSIRIGVILLGLLWALDLLDATALVRAVLGTAGLVGIALGFALRDVVENYVAGVLLGLRQPFSLGDHVVVDVHEGKVAALTTRATTLITLDGNHLRLPNSLVFKGVILNYTRNPLRRIALRVGVGVREDIGRALRAGVQALTALPAVASQPPPLGVVLELAESSVLLEFSLWFNQEEAGFFRLRSDAIRAVKLMLEDTGIDMPAPIYQVELTRASTTAPAPSPPVERSTSTTEVESGPSVEDAVDAHVAREQALSESSNLLRRDAPRE